MKHYGGYLPLVGAPRKAGLGVKSFLTQFRGGLHNHALTTR